MSKSAADGVTDFMTSMALNAKDVAFGAAGYVAGLFKDEKDGMQDGKIANVYPGPRPGTFIDENGQVLVRDPKTGNLVNERSVGNLVNVFSPDIHKAITYEALGGTDLSLEDIRRIASANLSQDHHQFTPDFHFDNAEGILDIFNIIWGIENNFNSMKDTSEKNEVLDKLGQINHAYEDFYSHSNYVELFLEYNSDQEGKKTHLNEIPLFEDVFRTDKYLKFQEILINNLRTGNFNIFTDYFSNDPNSHNQMNHDAMDKRNFDYAKNLARRQTLRNYLRAKKYLFDKT